MKRRDFLKMTAAASAGIAVSGTPVSALGQDSVFGNWLKGRATNGNIMVFILMAGGNDGLNTLIPLDRYAELNNARPNLVIPASDVLSLSGQANTGLHPSMTGMQSMFNAGELNIIQGVSYPNNNYSHFRATDIYMSGSEANVNEPTGWLGRTIESQLPGAPQAYPNSTFSDPLAIEIGSSASLFLSGVNGTNGMSISSISSFYNIVNNTVDPAPNTKAGNELTFLRYISQQTNAYNQVIQSAANMGSNLATYPTSSLANQLKIVANLISGGLQTPFYIVRQGGYDTHFTQVDNDPKVGRHANLLGDLSGAISAFQTDLKMLGKDNNVAGMTISEFGRRIIENASVGTDHGKAGPAFVFGKHVNPTVLGTSPVLPMNATVSDQVPMQHDFKDVYASVLDDWMGMTQSESQTVLNQNVNVQPVFCPNTSLVALNNPCFNASLPVDEYTYFTAVSDGCANKLTWGTRDEKNLIQFDIERSKNGVDFERIGTVDARNDEENNYEFSDWDLSSSDPKYFYRFKAVDSDGKFSYSITRTVVNECNKQEFLASIYPNPTQQELNLILNTHEEIQIGLEVVSISGRVVQKESFLLDEGRSQQRFDIGSLPKGVYVAKIMNLDNRTKLADIKFIKN